MLTFTDAWTPSLDAGTAVLKTILSEALRYSRENCMARSAFRELEGFCASLEQELGVALFARTARAVTLTEQESA